jgi:hypothetical protein
MHVMNAQDAIQRSEQGMQFIAIGSDLRMMTERGREWLAQIDPERLNKSTIGY